MTNYSEQDRAEALAGHMPIVGTDLEVVAYVNANGHLVVRVNKGGVCVLDAGLQHATGDKSPVYLMNFAALTRPILRDLEKPDALELLGEGTHMGNG